MHVDVPAVSSSDLSLPAPREGSKQVASRVAAARDRQAARYAGKGVASNAEVDGQLLDEVATPESEGRKLLAEAAERFKLSARGYHRVLRVARTLADLEASAGVRRVHVAEALSYRRIAPART
jgi:magnesium chelatase family protein